MPAEQFVHVCAERLDQLPALHARHVPDPDVENDPPSHAVQTDIELAPITVEYVPATQFVQTPAWSSNQLPGLQLMQVVDPSVDHDPESHCKQTSDDTAPSVVEYDPALHALHCDDDPDEYVPALQDIHETDPAVEYDPAEHCMHVLIAAVE